MVSLSLLIVFVVVPIYRVGLWKYASDQMEINPFIARVMLKYTDLQASQLSDKWYDRTEEVMGEAVRKP